MMDIMPSHVETKTVFFFTTDRSSEELSARKYPSSSLDMDHRICPVSTLDIVKS